MFMRIALAALIVLPLLTGCGGGGCHREYGCWDGIEQGDRYEYGHVGATLTISPELTPGEVEALHTAVEAWADATAGRAYVRLMLTSDADSLPERLVVRRAKAGELSSKERAAYHRDAIVIDNVLESTGYIVPALVHELGHFFGLGHESDPNDIMFPHTHKGMPTAPTTDAVSDLAAIYQW